MSTETEIKQSFSPTDQIDTKYLELWSYNLEKGLRMFFRLEHWRGRAGFYPGIFAWSVDDPIRLNATIHDMEKSGDESGIERVLNDFVKQYEQKVFNALADVHNRIVFANKERYRGMRVFFYTTTKAERPCFSGVHTVETSFTVIPPRINKEIHIERYLSPTEKIKRFFTSLKQE